MSLSHLPRPARRLRTTASALAAAAVAVGAGVWVAVPVAAPAADPVAVTQPLAAGLPLAHPVKPPQPAAVPTAPRARDPFRPLLTPPEQSTSVPAGAGSGSAPQVGAPAPEPAPAQPSREWMPQFPTPVDPSSGGSGGGSGGGVTAGSPLELTRVEGASDRLVAVLAVDGRPVRAAVGDSFGPGGQLLLLSLQQGPADGQWTAVVQVGQGEPFDVVTGTPTRLP